MKIKQTLKSVGLFFVFSVLVLPGVFSVVSSTPAFAALNCAGGSTDTPGSSGIAGGKEFCAYGQGVSVNGAKAAPKNFVCPSGSTLIQTTIYVGQQPSYGCATTAVASSPGGSNTTPTPSDAAKKYCSSKGGGNAYLACVAGYDNPSDTKACDKFTAASNNKLCKSAQTDATSAAKAAASGTDSKQLGCDVAFTSPLTWIICPVVDILVSVVNGIDGLITTAMNVDVNSIFCTTSNTCDAYHKAWESFRNIALGLMVIAGLVIVIAQAMGTELLDAYTIRKTLPRVLVAAIAITLSWSLMKFAVQITDDLGFGIRHLIYAPFAGLKNNIDLTILGGGVGGFFGGLGVAGGVATAGIAAWIVAGGVGVLLSYLATAALAVFVAILVLTLRQVAIILFILVSPIAIVCYILPNTQRFYKLWWESFSKALMMFPIIAAFIAVGRVFAAVSFASGGALNGFIGFVAYFAPYFMIPLTFKMAGATMSRLGGMVQSRSEGASRGLQQFRGQARKKRRASSLNRMQTGNVFHGAPKGSRREKFNSAAQSTAFIGAAGKNPLRMGDRIRAAKEGANLAGGAEGLEKSKFFAPLVGDDDAGHAIIEGGGDRNAEIEYLRKTGNYTEDGIKQKMAHIDMARNEMGQEALGQAAFYSTLKASTAYDTDPTEVEKNADGSNKLDEQGNTVPVNWGIGKAMSDIDTISNGNAQTRAQMVGKAKEIAGQAGRPDMSASFSAMYQESEYIGQAKTPQERKARIAEANERLTDEIVKIEGPGGALGGKGRAVEKLLPAMQRRITKSYEEVGRANTALQGSGTLLQSVQAGRTVAKPDGTGNYSLQEAQTLHANNEARHYEADTQRIRVLASTKALHDVAGQISQEKATVVAEGLFGHTIPGTHTTVLDAMNAEMDDGRFNEMRNEFRSNYGRGASQQMSAEEAAIRARQMQEEGGQPPLPGGGVG